MFLNYLEGAEKDHFLQVAKHAVLVDGKVTGSEVDMLQEFMAEMGFEDDEELKRLQALTLDPESANEGQFHKSVEFFSSASLTTRNVVFMELAALLISDDHLEESEKELMGTIQRAFTLPDDTAEGFINWLINMKKLYNQGLTLVGMTGQE